MEEVGVGVGVEVGPIDGSVARVGQVGVGLRTEISQTIVRLPSVDGWGGIRSVGRSVGRAASTVRYGNRTDPRVLTYVHTWLCLSISRAANSR